MNNRTLGRTGLKVSPLGFGGAPIGFLQADQERVGRILNILLDGGVNIIDTAAAYAGSEAAIGTAVAHRRDEFFLVSKCGSAGADAGAPAWSRQLILRTIDESLRKLRTDRIDIMLLHSCGMPTLHDGAALAALVEAREAGKIGVAGYSGDNEAAAFAATLEDIDVIETSVNICDQRNIDWVLPVAQEYDVGVIAKRPIANAAWRKISEQRGLYQTYAETYTERLRRMDIDLAELGFEGPPAEVWPEIALRFTLGQPGIQTAIIGTTREENARRNLEWAETGPLPPEVAQQIRAAFRDADPDGTWQGET